jgi:signal transduction histidine kinase
VATRDGKRDAERNHRLEALETELRGLELVISSVADGFVIIDRQGRVVRMNRAAREIYRAILGTENADRFLATRPLDELFERWDSSGRRIERADLPLWRALQRNESVPGQELRVSSRAGRERWIIGSAAPLHDPCGAVIGAVAVIQDITALKEAQRVRDDVLSMLSHELRTPLTTIKAAIASLLRPETPWDESNPAEFLQIAEQECDKLAELINRLLDASALRAGALHVQPEPMLIQRIAARAVSRCLIRTPDRAVRVHFKRGFPAVLADPRRIEQVIQNLVDNALKYSPPEAEVCVSGRALRDGRTAITVADRGVGIRPEDRALIFKPFYRGATQGRGVGGNGLGLAICRAIVEAHGSSLVARARRGGGTAFCFELPLAPASPPRGGR